MTTHHEPAVLPDLERELLRAARRRAAPARGRRRWRRTGLLGLAAGLVVAGGATATVQLLTVDRGATSQGAYTIETRPAPDGKVCLQLRYTGHAPAYGCGVVPDAATPLGVVVADSAPVAGDGVLPERVVYGLAAAHVARVDVIDADGAPHAATPRRVDGVPGRFFTVTVENEGRIELRAYDDAGRQVARVGSHARPARKPQSHAEAVAQGDPAGFAPGVAAPDRYRLDGRPISAARFAALMKADRPLSCTQTRDELLCRQR